MSLEHQQPNSLEINPNQLNQAIQALNKWMTQLIPDAGHCRRLTEEEGYKNEKSPEENNARQAELRAKKYPKAVEIEQAINKAGKGNIQEVKILFQELIQKKESEKSEAVKQFEQLKKQNPDAEKNFNELIKEIQTEKTKISTIKNKDIKSAKEQYISILEEKKISTLYYSHLKQSNIISQELHLLKQISI